MPLPLKHAAGRVRRVAHLVDDALHLHSYFIADTDPVMQYLVYRGAVNTSAFRDFLYRYFHRVSTSSLVNHSISGLVLQIILKRLALVVYELVLVFLCDANIADFSGNVNSLFYLFLNFGSLHKTCPSGFVHLSQRGVHIPQIRPGGTDSRPATKNLPAQALSPEPGVTCLIPFYTLQRNLIVISVMFMRSFGN